jgi:peroxiredoxin
LAKRISYLVGSDGHVLKAYPDVDPKNHAQEVLKDYRSLVAATD